MKELAMCRVCLAEDVRLRLIANTHLQEVYESLTLLPLETEDNRPIGACYICCAGLQNCYRLRKRCFRSEELLTHMLSSDVLQPLNVQEKHTQRLRVEHPVIHLSIGNELQNKPEDVATEDSVHRTDAPDVRDHDTVQQQHNEDIIIKMEPEEEYDARLEDDIQSSLLEDPLDVTKRKPNDVVTDTKKEPQEEYDVQLHVQDPLDVIKSEPDDVETDDKYIKLEIEDTILEEKDPNVGGSYSELADNICPKVVEIVWHGIDVRDSATDVNMPPIRRARFGARTSATQRVQHFRARRTSTEVAAERQSNALRAHRANRAGARVSKEIKIAALKDTEDATTNQRKIKVKQKEETEDKTIKEPKKTRVKKPVTTSKILKAYEKLDFKLNKYENVVKSVNNVCEEKSTNNTSIENNVSDVSISKNNLFSCSTCKKQFNQKSNLIYHSRIHTGEKPYECNYCQKCFVQKAHLKSHLRKHTGDRPHECNYCKKCFIQKSDLKKHIRIHTSERPYVCNLCNKGFCQNIGLINHMRTHTGERPFECPVCKKCFTRNGVLQNHIRTHTSEKPFQCNICQKCFTQKCNLMRHVLLHTSEKPK